MSESRTELIERVHAARRALDRAFRDAPWFVGTGIVPAPDDSERSVGFGLRLVVDPDDGPREKDVPTSFDGFPLEIVRRPRYDPRARAPEETPDE